MEIKRILYMKYIFHSFHLPSMNLSRFNKKLALKATDTLLLVYIFEI